VTRNVFLCYVCGAAGSGKTSLLRAFQGKRYTSVYETTTKPISVVNSVEIGGSEKYLVVCQTHGCTRRRCKKLNVFVR
jgi:Ras family protein T1